jgi:serine/threonine-protein kinase
MLDAPTVIGRYALFGRIGAGGMGVVHLGRLLGSAGFERAVAIKRIHPALATDQQFIALFRDELRLLARVRHQHVISALDVVETDGHLLLVMEYVHGESLAALLQRSARAKRPIPIEIAVTIACGVLRGLHAAHTATSAAGEPLGIIHRDVSPHNVLVGCDGFARVVDFGVAKWAESRKVTQIGELRGKPGYIAPEQILGEPASPRSDVYALSVVLWEMLAAQRLFAGRSVAETIERVVSGDVPALGLVTDRPISDRIEAVVLRGLCRDPAARFASAREMAAALEAAGRLVSPEAVGDWVSETAGAPLRDRASQLTWAENCAIGSARPDPDDLEPTLVRSLELREEPITRDFPLEAVAPGSTGPRRESPLPQPPRPRVGKRSVLLIGAATLASLIGVRVYQHLSATAEEAVRARAAAAVARAGLSPSLPSPSASSPVVAAAAPATAASASVAPATPAVAAAPPRSSAIAAPRKPPAKPVAAAVEIKPVSIDGF